jgi:hypothetical protein
MRFHPTWPQLFVWVLALSAVLTATARSQAQDIIYSDAPIEQLQPQPLRHGWGFFHSRRPPIPRTYSYYYDTWFNQPRHFRVVGPDGKTYWRTTVRDLPLGTPWQSYEAIEIP